MRATLKGAGRQDLALVDGQGLGVVRKVLLLGVKSEQMRDLAEDVEIDLVDLDVFDVQADQLVVSFTISGDGQKTYRVLDLLHDGAVAAGAVRDTLSIATTAATAAPALIGGGLGVLFDIVVVALDNVNVFDIASVNVGRLGVVRIVVRGIAVGAVIGNLGRDIVGQHLVAVGTAVANVVGAAIGNVVVLGLIVSHFNKRD